MNLQTKAEQLNARILHVGGPVNVFEQVGRLQLITCLKTGLYPDSKVLDIGCGALRGGYWMIHFLEPNGYCGIEPDRAVLEGGLQNLLEPGLYDLKKPRFDHNTEFDASVFGEVFDFYVARSVWSHTSKEQIITMLESFIRHTSPHAVFLTSYCRAGFLRRRDYQGNRGIAKSEGRMRPMVYHRFAWIKRECQRRQLTVEEIKDPALNHGRQTWLKIIKNKREQL